MNPSKTLKRQKLKKNLMNIHQEIPVAKAQLIRGRKRFPYYCFCIFSTSSGNINVLGEK